MNKRQPAFIVCIKDIISGEFIKTEGWEPNYVKTPFGLEVSRVNVLGTIVDKSDQEISLDDSTGIIKVRSFEAFPEFEDVHIGDVVFVIGKVREYGETYIGPEICKKISNKWIEKRKQEWEYIEQLFLKGKIIQEKKVYNPEFSSGDTIEEQKKEESDFDKILSFIDTEDKGEGVSKEKIMSSFPNNSETVQALILEGDIFEIKPDVFKVLK